MNVTSILFICMMMMMMMMMMMSFKNGIAF